MNRSAKWYNVSHMTSTTPGSPLWVLEVWIDAHSKLKWAYYPVVAIRTKFCLVYSHNGEKPTIAPHHTELIKQGWQFEGAREVNDVLYIDPRLMEDSLLASSDYNGQGKITIVNQKSNDDLIGQMGRELGYQDAETQAPDSKFTEKAAIINRLRTMKQRRLYETRDLMILLQDEVKITLSELSLLIDRDISWIFTRLGLDKLTVLATSFVRDGTINIANAYALAKLPQIEQADYLMRAQTMHPAEFIPIVNNKVKEIRDSKRQARVF